MDEIWKVVYGFMEFYGNWGLMYFEIVNDKIVILESYFVLVDFMIIDFGGKD